MRKFVLPVIAIMLIATPAAAQDRRPVRAPDLDSAAAALSSSMVREGLTAIVGQFADALLDTRVGPLAALTDRRDGVRANDTIGDVLRRDDPAFDDRLRDTTRRSLTTAGQALGGAAAMSRELQATADRLRAVLAGTRGY